MKKIYRLKKNHDIAKIVQKKQRISKEYYVVYYQYNNSPIPKVAFSVSKKYGIAVERNKAKRIARSIVQKHVKTLNYINMVIVIKNKAKNTLYDLLEKELFTSIKMILNKQPKGENNESTKI